MKIKLKTTDSTNSWAKRNYQTFDKDKIYIITAEEQTAGRGQFQKKWLSPKDVNLYVTFYFSLGNLCDLDSLAKLLSLSIVEVLQELGFHPQIKEPNDILLSSKKVAGVLCETITCNEAIDVFLGLGLNVNMGEDDLKAIDQRATSLMLESHERWDKEFILNKLEEQFLKDLEIFKKEGFQGDLKKHFQSFLQAPSANS